MKVIYIAGYGRSGSTILSGILGQHSSIVSTGELSLLLDEIYDNERLCSCGLKYSNCEFWGEFLRLHPDGNKHSGLIRNVEKLTNLPWLTLNRTPIENRQVYRDLNADIFDFICSRSNCSYVVDSSKSARCIAGRPLALNRITHLDVFVIHLTRNGISTLDSLVSTGSNWAKEGYKKQHRFSALRAVFGWVMANYVAGLMRIVLGKKRYIHIKYEEFVNDPASQLTAIGEFCGFSNEQLIKIVAENEPLQFGHTIGGNRLRLNANIRLNRSVNTNEKSALRWRYKLLFYIFAGWMNRQYGY